MQILEDNQKNKPTNPRGEYELVWIGITALVMVGLFWVPKDFWLALNFLLFFALFHYLAWRAWKKGEKREAIAGFLWYLGPIYLAFTIGLMVLWQRGNLNW